MMIQTKKDDDTEMLPLVDENGLLIGAATRKECHDGSKPLHPVVHLHVFNEPENFICKNVRNGKPYSRANGILL